MPGMHFRVEIQREGGRRRSEPLVIYGQIESYVRAFGQRSVVMLQLTDTGSVRDIPTLYSPTVTRFTHEGLLLSGMELSDSDAWVAQSWWCAYSTPEAAVEANGSTRPRR